MVLRDEGGRAAVIQLTYRHGWVCPGDEDCALLKRGYRYPKKKRFPSMEMFRRMQGTLAPAPKKKIAPLKKSVPLFR